MHFPSAPAATVHALGELLACPRRIAIVTHYNPDGDAMGSSLGLCAVLKKAGHDVRVVLPNTPPANLHWMPGSALAIAWDKHKEESDRTVRQSELLFCLDFNKPDRVGGLEAALRAAPVKVLIDHHRHPDAFAAVAFSDVQASSTAQMVFDIISALGLAHLLDQESAMCLYTGLMTDSGSFRFSSTTPHTLEVAAELMKRGVVPERIHEAIMDDNTESRLRLLGFALNERLTVYPEMRTAVIVLSKADQDRYDHQPGDTEGLVNYGLSIRGIRLAAFIAERPDVVKLSLRSKGALPVNEFLASHFNGGGHGNAAGGHAKEPLAAVVERFLKEVPAFLAAHPA
jgi:bifunctional oligoribonuclease and PAP phosphatase NrnA